MNEPDLFRLAKAVDDLKAEIDSLKKRVDLLERRAFGAHVAPNPAEVKAHE